MNHENERELCIEYDEMVIGKRTKFSQKYFSSNVAERELYALTVIRYAFDKYLRWPRRTLSDNLTADLIEKLHLKNLVAMIKFPIEYSRDRDWFYIVSAVYDDMKIGRRNRTVHLYEQILSGKINKFPKEYFLGTDGIVRACFCLQYALNSEYAYMSAEELYRLTLTSEFWKFLDNYRLAGICRDMFDDPIDFLHTSLPGNGKNEFLMKYAKYVYYQEDSRRKEKLK